MVSQARAQDGCPPHPSLLLFLVISHSLVGNQDMMLKGPQEQPWRSSMGYWTWSSSLRWQKCSISLSFHRTISQPSTGQMHYSLKTEVILCFDEFGIFKNWETGVTGHLTGLETREIWTSHDIFLIWLTFSVSLFFPQTISQPPTGQGTCSSDLRWKLFLALTSWATS